VVNKEAPIQYWNEPFRFPDFPGLGSSARPVLYYNPRRSFEMQKSVAAFLIACISTLAHSGPLPGAPATAQKPQADGSAKIQFENTSMGEMRDKDGIHLGFTSYKGSDGSRVMVLYEDFESSAMAQKYFEKQISWAAKLIERKKKVDASKRVVGERAEILLRLDDTKTIPAVLWTDGVKFYEIYSEARESVLELEAVYKY
jgi:hypothetical protein